MYVSWRYQRHCLPSGQNREPWLLQTVRAMGTCRHPSAGDSRPLRRLWRSRQRRHAAPRAGGRSQAHRAGAWSVPGERTECPYAARFRLSACRSLQSGSRCDQRGTTGNAEGPRPGIHATGIEGAHLALLNAEDHIRALERDVLRDPAPIWSPLTLCRATLESTAVNRCKLPPARSLRHRQCPTRPHGSVVAR